MLSPRWRKVLSDLWSNKVRTVLVMLTIAVGIFAVGSVSSTFMILLEDMDAAYQAINSESATIYCDLFDDEFLEVMRREPGVAEVEGRSDITARALGKTDTKILLDVMAIPSIEKMRISRIGPHDPPDRIPVLVGHELLLERSIAGVLPVKPGDLVEIELADGQVRELRLAGLVRDVSFPSYTFASQVRAYVTPETLEWLGGPRNYTTMLLTVAEGRTDEAHIRAVAQQVADKVEKSGREVYTTIVYQPGRHWASDITQALAILMGGLGLLSILLSAFLVVNTITALLGQQMQQIGMMKAVGGGTTQIVVMYLVLVLCFGFLALLLAAPLSAILGYATAAGVSGMLNFDLAGFRVPPLAIILQVFVAFAAPLGAALIPVLNGARMTVREAVSAYGLGKGRFGTSLIDRLLERVRGLPRPVLLSLRNTFRRKVRLALTLSTLILGGATFIAVFNLWAAFDVVLDETMGYIISDVNVNFDRGQRAEKVRELVMSIPGVASMEGWGFSGGQILSSDKTTAVDITFFAPPASSTLIKPVLTAGRWLLPEDENAIVIGNHLIKERPDLKVGDEVVVKIEGREYTWHIVGIYKLVGNVVPPIVYANYEHLAKVRHEIEQFYALRIVTQPHDPATQMRVRNALEVLFKQAGIPVTQINTGHEVIVQQTATTDILVYFLLIMAVLIALVGGLGLMSTMSMNVLERTREIGVIRAIGASDMAVLRVVIVEGLLIGLISWAVGAVLAWPISIALNYAIGTSMLNSPMQFVFSWSGFGVWLVCVLVISTLASLLPARNASRLTVREVLAYE